MLGMRGLENEYYDLFEVSIFHEERLNITETFNINTFVSIPNWHSYSLHVSASVG
jgi:hypothetical protein